MALPALTYRRIADVTPAGSAIADFLTALSTALAATTYTDGSARTPGLGRAWQVVASTAECVVLAAPGNVSRVIVAGASASRTPKMYSSDTFLVSALHVGIGPDGGTLTTWDGAGANDPLGAGKRFSGYVRCSVAANTGGLLCVYESVDAIVVQVRIGTSWYGFIAGAWLDPLSDSNLDCEADGKLYAVAASSSAAWSSTWATSGAFWSHNTSANQQHAISFQPGTSTMVGMVPPQVALAGTNWGLLRSGRNWVDALSYRDQASTSNAIGALRGAGWAGQGRQRQTRTAAGIDQVYVVGGSDSADCNVMGLFAV